MKQFIVILLCLSSLFAQSQTHIVGKWRYDWFGCDSVLFIPGDTLASAPLNSVATKSSVMYIKGVHWVALGGGGGPFYDSTLMASRYKVKSDSITLATAINTKQPILGIPNTIKKYLNGYGQFPGLNSDSMAEGSTNKFYTDTRARAAISLTTSGTSWPATYNNSTGVLNIPQVMVGGGSVTVRDSLSYINAAKFNMIADGVTDNTAFLQGLINAGYKAIYIPGAVLPYIFTGTVQLKDSITIFGDGLQTVLKQTSNVILFRLGFATGGLKCTLKDFTIQGTYGGTGNTNQKGIVCDSVNGVMMQHIGGYFMAGPVITIMNNALMPGGNNYTYGNLVDGCYGQTNQAGVWIDVRGEYNRITNNMFNDGGYGIYVAGGNNIITGNNCSADTYSIYLDAGANHGHGSVTGNSDNHSVYGLYSNGVTLGMSLSNNMFYSDSIVIVNSDGINIHGGDIDPTGIRITNSTNINFVFNDFKSTPTWVTSGSTGSIIVSVPGGYKTININYPSKGNSITNHDGIVYYGANEAGVPDVNVQQHKFSQTIVGMTGGSDLTRDFSGGQAGGRMDGNSSSPTDFWQFYRTGTTGFTLSVLDNAANRALTVIPTGGTGLGGTPDASAKLDIQTTLQGFLPPRMTLSQFAAISSKATSLHACLTDSSGRLALWTGSKAVTYVTSDQLPIIPDVSSGVVSTPTITSSSNATAITAYEMRYTKIGGVVHISGTFAFTASNPALVVTVIVSLPIPSGNLSSRQASGTAACNASTGSGLAGAIGPNTGAASILITFPIGTAGGGEIATYEATYDWTAP